MLNKTRTVFSLRVNFAIELRQWSSENPSWYPVCMGGGLHLVLCHVFSWSQAVFSHAFTGNYADLCGCLSVILCSCLSVILYYPGPWHPVNSSGGNLFKLSRQMKVIAQLCYVSENIIYTPGSKLEQSHLFPFSERLLFCATCLMSANCCFTYFPWLFLVF